MGVAGCVTVDFLPPGLRGREKYGKVPRYKGLLQLFQLTIWWSCHPIDLPKRLSWVDSD